MAVSPYLKLFCGARSFSWRELIDASYFAANSQEDLKHLLRKQGGEGASLSTGLNRITTLTTIRFSARRQNSSLLRMLTRTCKWLATDPRNKCLTLAGLAGEESW
jgi:hypothetical protein